MDTALPAFSCVGTQVGPPQGQGPAKGSPPPACCFHRLLFFSCLHTDSLTVAVIPHYLLSLFGEPGTVLGSVDLYVVTNKTDKIPSLMEPAF